MCIFKNSKHKGNYYFVFVSEIMDLNGLYQVIWFMAAQLNKLGQGIMCLVSALLLLYKYYLFI